MKLLIILLLISMPSNPSFAVMVDIKLSIIKPLDESFIQYQVKIQALQVKGMQYLAIYTNYTSNSHLNKHGIGVTTTLFK